MNALNNASQCAQAVPALTGTTLSLPSGQLEVSDNGRLFSSDGQWVVAVGLSAKVFLVVRLRNESYVPIRLLHELVDWLIAQDYQVVPVEFRCPLAWRHDGSFESMQRWWASRFFADSHRCFSSPHYLYRATR
jgi:hypothetical protein